MENSQYTRKERLFNKKEIFSNSVANHKETAFTLRNIHNNQL